MVTLALDTTTAAGSAALVHNGRLLEMSAIDPSAPIATRVPGDLMGLLDRHRVSLTDINLVAVATGPGSFTGLRIGIAAMQGLALANAIPLIGVSSFEALASLALADARLEPAGHVAVWIDAWRGEVYGAVYARSEDLTLPGAVSARSEDLALRDAVSARSEDLALRDAISARSEDLALRDAVSARSEDLALPDAVYALREVVEPAVAPPEELLRKAASVDLRTTVFIGDAAVKYRDAVPGRVVDPTPLIAGAVARIASARAANGEAPPPHAIRPLYVRRPDAVLARERSG
jgi:tRNA threonylcarbamoyl adenosine modification protein YeaZ